MKNKYQKLKARHQKEVNEFPLGVAFSQEQLDRMMENLVCDRQIQIKL